LLPVFRAFPTEGIRSVPALFALKSLPGLSGRRAFWPKIREFAASVRTVEISMPLDQIRATKFHDELEQLHGELDQVRRDGWDSGARVSVLEGRIAHIVGILLGLCALGVVVPLIYLFRNASSFWGNSVIVAVGAGVVALAFWTLQHFYTPPR
jgi:hypothetical protein